MLSSQRAAFSRRCRICQNISFFPFIRHKYMNGVTFPKTNMPKDNICTKLFSIFLLIRKGNNAYDPYFNSMIWHITLCQYLQNMEIMPKGASRKALLRHIAPKDYRISSENEIRRLYLLVRLYISIITANTGMVTMENNVERSTVLVAKAVSPLYC